MAEKKSNERRPAIAALRLALALTGFGLGFSLMWFSVLALLPSVLAGAASFALVWVWGQRIETAGPSRAALERLAMHLAFRKGSVSADELASVSGKTLAEAREVLDELAERGLAQEEDGRYRFP